MYTTTDAAKPALCCIGVGGHNRTFARSAAGGRRAAAVYALIETDKLNDRSAGSGGRAVSVIILFTRPSLP